MRKIRNFTLAALLAVSFVLAGCAAEPEWKPELPMTVLAETGGVTLLFELPAEGDATVTAQAPEALAGVTFSLGESPKAALGDWAMNLPPSACRLYAAVADSLRTAEHIADRGEDGAPTALSLTLDGVRHDIHILTITVKGAPEN